MKYRKKPVIVGATQWFKNGDHPEDNSVLMADDHRSKEYLSEGKVVRYYRKPNVEGGLQCNKCGTAKHDHGWVDTLEGGHIVCPGDWIITGVKGEYYPCKPDIFQLSYEKEDVLMYCKLNKHEVEDETALCKAMEHEHFATCEGCPYSEEI